MTKLSLSDSLQSIKKRKSPKKKPVPIPAPRPKDNPNPKRSSESKNDSKKISVSSAKHVKPSDKSVKVIRQTPKSKSRKHKITGVSPQKDIFQIQQKIQEKVKPKPPEKATPMPLPKPSPKKPDLQKQVDTQGEKPKRENPVPTPPMKKEVSMKPLPNKPLIPPHVNKKHRRSRSRSKTRRRSKSRSRSSMKRHPKPKASIQVTDNTEDIETIKQKIQEIRNKKSNYIREHLRKQGVRVSGKSDRLLKDIYFYSTACNINIRHET